VTTDEVRVDPAHAGQLAAWDGDEGAYWAAHATRFERSLARYQPPFLAAARIGRRSHVLDVGCGTGGTTLDAARIAVDGSVTGVDLSAAMLRAARQEAEREGLANVSFLQADAQVHAFSPESFDMAVARTSAMFFADKAAAVANLARALRPSGRLTLLVWQPMVANEWIVEISAALAAGRRRPPPPPDGPQPFSMSDPAQTRELLVDGGFVDLRIDGLVEPMWFGADADDTVPFLLGQVGWMLDGLDDSARRSALDDLRTRVEAHQGPDGVTFGSACWLVTARRR
jgi:SAM-dependent methyltransferase